MSTPQSRRRLVRRALLYGVPWSTRPAPKSTAINGDRNRWKSAGRTVNTAGWNSIDEDVKDDEKDGGLWKHRKK